LGLFDKILLSIVAISTLIGFVVASIYGTISETKITLTDQELVKVKNPLRTLLFNIFFGLHMTGAIVITYEYISNFSALG